MTIFDILQYALSKCVKWITVALIFAILTGSLAYFFIPKKYTATSTVAITNSNYTTSQALSIQKLVSGDAIVDLAQKKIESISEFSSDSAQVGSMIGASIETGTPNINITITSNNPRLALKLNEIVTADLLTVSGNYVPGVPLTIYSKPKLNPNFVYPNIKNEALLGFLAGILISVIISVKSDFFSTNVKNERALRVRLQLENLGNVSLKKRK